MIYFRVVTAAVLCIGGGIAAITGPSGPVTGWGVFFFVTGFTGMAYYIINYFEGNQGHAALLRVRRYFWPAITLLLATAITLVLVYATYMAYGWAAYLITAGALIPLVLIWLRWNKVKKDRQWEQWHNHRGPTSI